MPDADGDGRGELLVGSRQESPGDSPIGAGRAYLFSGAGKGTAVEGTLPVAPLTLDAPHPNPFADTTTVSFTLAVPSAVRLSVHDGLGREVAVLAAGARAAGRHEAVLDASGLPAGVYLVRLAAGGVVAVRTVTLVR